MHWIIDPIILQGRSVNLLPLQEMHFEELIECASDKRIWQHYIMDCSNRDTMLKSLHNALQEKKNGSQYPFIIQQNINGKIIGSTRLLDINPQHKKVEIGWTWMHPDYWGSIINTECKLLLLHYCFEILQAARVQLKTDEQNIRSRRAIEKLGAIPEGILRNDMLRENGTYRNSAYYSIINSEWPEIHKKLQHIMLSHGR